MLTANTAQSSVRIKSSGNGRYTIRATGSVGEGAHHRQQIVDFLTAHEGDPSRIVEVWYTADPCLTTIFSDHATESLGWEGLILPGSNSERRALRLPAGVVVSAGIRAAEPHRLQSLHRWARDNFNDPRVDHDESMLIQLDGEVIGWVPVWRLSTYTSLVRHCLIDDRVFADEVRRRTLLKLGTYSVAVNYQLTKNRSVVSWLPDDGDDVNVFKLQVGAPAVLTHWMVVRTRCDLQVP